ncbi:nibrin-like [Xylocopa sonorina]|uniref:nibrin-like n=1 Tax=Xylocopa sonorina TaxID=1818115 RepID=UPI00403A9BBF
MWYLVNVKGERLYLKPNVEVTFGRKKGDVLFPDDESISRLHASVCVTPKQIFEMGETTSTCRLKDLGSKYGTYICQENEMMAVSKEGYNLKHNDRVRIGLQNSIFLVMNASIITLTSGLVEADRNRLKSLMDHIDGAIINNWLKCCTHLTVTKATLTEKVICAMASAIPIVTVNYWEQVKVAVENGQELPNTKHFIPLISEPYINKEKLLISPNEKRTTLFQNLIFVLFSTQQYKTYGKIIQLAGGKSLLYSKKPLTIKELSAKNVIVLQYPNNEATQSTQNIAPEYDSIYDALQANDRKMVPEFEIPLAILHCSTEKYCNPTFRFSKLLKRPSEKCDSSEVLVLDTQDAVPSVQVLSNVLSSARLKSELDAECPNNEPDVVQETCDDFDQPADRLPQDSAGELEKKQDSDESNCIEETNDSCSSADEENVDLEPCFREMSNYIPETNESQYPDSSQSPEKVHSTVDSVEIQQNASARRNEATVVIEETPDSKLIDVTANESSDFEDEWSNECINKNLSEIRRRNEPNNLSETSNSEEENSEIEIVKSSTDKLDVEGDEDLNVRQIVEKNEAVAKNSRAYSVQLEKSAFSDKSEVEYKVEIRRNDFNNSVAREKLSNFSKSASSIMRVNPGRKTFIKVFQKIPKKRVTLSDMCVWNENECTKRMRVAAEFC